MRDGLGVGELLQEAAHRWRCPLRSLVAAHATEYRAYLPRVGNARGVPGPSTNSGTCNLGLELAELGNEVRLGLRVHARRCGVLLEFAQGLRQLGNHLLSADR